MLHLNDRFRKKLLTLVYKISALFIHLIVDFGVRDYIEEVRFRIFLRCLSLCQIRLIRQLVDF
jgi:hypothetical protein